jgi:glycosyltransferase involved in cell wall biosynthesis
VSASDLILAVSNNTALDVRRFAAEEGFAPPAINVIRLADTLRPRSVDEPATPREFVLYVSTIEVRKNHVLLYHVWRRLSAKYGNRLPRLICVGRKGWLADELIYCIQNDPLTRDGILVNSDVSDTELGWLYRNCLLTVYPSHYEGWGLPVSESLASGKYCIASSTSSLPEAGGKWSDYCDPVDTLGWERLVERAIFDRAYRELRESEIQRSYRVVTWSETANAVADAISDHLSPRLGQLA